MIGRLRRVPVPLALLLAAAAIAATVWCILKPALQGPDELAHFTYTQRIVEDGQVPWDPTSNGAPLPVSANPEAAIAEIGGGVGPLSANVAARPLWTEPDVALWSKQDRASDRGNAGETSSIKNPPVYYLYEAIPYGIAHGGSFFDRLFLMRIANVLLYLAALAFVWLIAGELLGRGPLQLTAAASVAFLPPLLNIVATVDPDIMLVAEWSAALYLMVLLLKRGPSVRLFAWLAGVCIVSGFTHGRALPMLVPAAMTALIVVGRAKGWRFATPLRVTLAAWAIYVPVVLVWAGRGPKGHPREFVSYLWQFYLPRLSFMTPKLGPPDYGARKAWSDHFWGALANLEVLMPNGLADALWLAVRVGLVLLVVVLAVRWRALRRQSAIVLVLGSAALAELLSLHLVAYRSLIGFQGDPILTGRYLLPLLGLMGVAVALLVSVLPRRLGALASGAIIAGLLAVQFVAAGMLLERFYA